MHHIGHSLASCFGWKHFKVTLALPQSMFKLAMFIGLQTHAKHLNLHPINVSCVSLNNDSGALKTFGSDCRIVLVTRKIVYTLHWVSSMRRGVFRSSGWIELHRHHTVGRMIPDADYVSFTLHDCGKAVLHSYIFLRVFLKNKSQRSFLSEHLRLITLSSLQYIKILVTINFQS